jgi:Pyridoxal-phosphate dependent enzyme
MQGRSTSSAQPVKGVLACIGDTPLVELVSLSQATGCRILAKCEWLNPGGSIKDRVALQIVADAEQNGKLKPNGIVTEGTAGSTGVALAMVCAAKGYRHAPAHSTRAGICHTCSAVQSGMLDTPLGYVGRMAWFARGDHACGRLAGATSLCRTMQLLKRARRSRPMVHR